MLGDVLGHHVVGADEADALRLRRGGETAADDDVRLEVHDIGLELVDNARPFGLTRHGSANRSHGCGYQRQLVSRCTMIGTPSCSSSPVLRRTGRRRGDDVHLVAALRAGRRRGASANEADPLMSGAKVSPPIRIRTRMTLPQPQAPNDRGASTGGFAGGASRAGRRRRSAIAPATRPDRDRPTAARAPPRRARRCRSRRR